MWSGGFAETTMLNCGALGERALPFEIPLYERHGAGAGALFFRESS